MIPVLFIVILLTGCLRPVNPVQARAENPFALTPSAMPYAPDVGRDDPGTPQELVSEPEPEPESEPEPSEEPPIPDDYPGHHITIEIMPHQSPPTSVLPPELWLVPDELATSFSLFPGTPETLVYGPYGPYPIGIDGLEGKILNNWPVDISLCGDYRIEKLLDGYWTTLPLNISPHPPFTFTTWHSYRRWFSLHQDQFRYSPGLYRIAIDVEVHHNPSYIIILTAEFELERIYGGTYNVREN